MPIDVAADGQTAATRVGPLGLSLAVTLGFGVPLVSLFRENWLEYLLPVGLLLTLVWLAGAGIAGRDYLRAIPRTAGIAVLAILLLGLVAALRVADELSAIDRLRAIAAVLIPYFGLYCVTFFILVRATALETVILQGLAAGAAATAVILLLEPLTGFVSDVIFPATHGGGQFSLAHLNRTFLALAIFSWMAAPWLNRRFGTPLAGLLAPAGALLLSLIGESETVAIALPAAAIVYLAALRYPRPVAGAVFAGAIFVVMSAPFIYPVLFETAHASGLLPSKLFMIRAEIWDAVSLFALDAPLFGQGMQATALGGPHDIARIYYPFDEIPHPHNGILQVWTDLGALGAIAFSVMLFGMWRATRAAAPDRVPHILAAFATAGLAFTATYSLWAPWWLGLLAMTASYAVATGGSVPRVR